MRITVVICSFLLLFSCKKEEGERAGSLGGNSFWPEMNYPSDNHYTAERYEFGKALFFDPRFSSDGMVSCATCHQPELYFADNSPTSPGAENEAGTRNSPSLVNIGYHPYFTREGGVPTLEMQVLVPIQEHNEFNSNIVLVAEQLNQDPVLREMSLMAYDEEITPYTITRGLANFERELISNDSKYDQYLRGEIALDPDEMSGMNLFFSDRTKCASCHSGIQFTSFEIVNNGLYTHYEDPCLARLTGLAQDSGKVKVPSLRNVAMTAPYMHDGSVTSLSEVLDHYIQGGKDHANQDERVNGFSLTQEEKTDLLAFLETLTDHQFSMH